MEARVTLTYGGIIYNNQGGHLLTEGTGKLVKSGNGQIIGPNVEPANCTLSVQAITFSATYGYSASPSGDIIITNSGNQTATINGVTVTG